ncbi:U-box domain-containing protein 33-like [Impatiens glandulifera]|uniref:U-box domain-containing protein 33-like n=1 Tax=Impatiens glandulifera TaxID=253017 RepID=UPI001FB0E15D|nr:U-box domain-containing protein 33-like [Impatiens glandulifera]
MIPETISTIRYPEIEMEIEMEEKLYVALGKELNDGKSTLSWALHHSGGRKICIIHIYQPAQRIPLMGTKFSVSQMDIHQVEAYRTVEKQETDKLLDEYKRLCDRSGVLVEVLLIEKDCIEKGIVELLSHHLVTKLVMGAAADSRYSRRMTEPKSKKASYVRLQAPGSCKIWFTCKGHLIYTREGSLGEIDCGLTPLILQPSPTVGSANSSPRTLSVTDGQNGWSATRYFRRVPSDNHEIQAPSLSSSGRPGGGIPNRRSPSDRSSTSSCEAVDYPILPSPGRISGQLESPILHRPSRDHLDSSPPSVLEGRLNDDIYDQLEQAMTEAENARREAFEESIRRRKAERDSIEANRRARASESLLAEQSRLRKEIEEELAKGREELEKMSLQLNKTVEEHRIANEQKSALESEIAKSEKTVQELEQKIFSAVELLQKYKKEQDELQLERDDAIRLTEELRRKQSEETSNANTSQFFSEFFLSEIEEATQNFDPSLKIGEGGYGSIYKGLLRHTQVAIKMLHSHSLQGPGEFQQEVEVLSKLRHPNLVTLIGACPDDLTLVYEYLPNGSLEDRLSCRENTPPLSWQTRIRIASELCSVLIFLHSCNPRGVIHGDLKPSNILLDINYVSKLSDFGICRIISQGEHSENQTWCCRTDPKGTFAYMDPEFISTGELTAKSDVYSFGIILLRLLTGRPALGIKKEIEHALDKGTLRDILDPTAGDWPFVQAKQLAHLAMRCCEMNRRNRPDLAMDVWKVLDPMRVSCGASSFRMSEDRCQIPHYFICPIFQEIMQDPHVAADGYTYELEALRGWLDSGHDTSPMTNLKLPQTNLVPNHALRSAIQEWLHLS